MTVVVAVADGGFSPYLGQIEAETYPPRHLIEAIRRFLDVRLTGLRSAGVPPPALGYPGADWGDAMSDIVLDAYEYAILARLPKLLAAQAAGQDVDGLVGRNLRHFIHHRRRRTNPFAYAVFKNAQVAAELAERHGALHARSTSGSARVNNQTQISWTGSFDDVDAERDIVSAALAATEGVSLVIPRLASQSEVVQRGLAGIFSALGDADDLNQTWFKTLVDVLQSLEERHRISTASDPDLNLRPADGDSDVTEPARLFGTPRAQSTRDDRIAFQELMLDLQDAIDKLPRQARLRARAKAILAELANHIEERRDEPAPSLRELARTMGIPRSSTHNAVQLIREAVAHVVQTNPDAFSAQHIGDLHTRQRSS